MGSDVGTEANELDLVGQAQFPHERPAFLEMIPPHILRRVAENDKSAPCAVFRAQPVDHDPRGTNQLDKALSRQDATVASEDYRPFVKPKLPAQHRLGASRIELVDIERIMDRPNLFGA